MTLDDLKSLPGYVYLATPYTRFRLGPAAADYEARVIAARLMLRGIRVLSPIAHSHAVSRTGLVDGMDEALWAYQDAPLLDAASAVIVVTMDGWSESKGVRAEIERARALGKPIVFLDPEHA